MSASCRANLADKRRRVAETRIRVSRWTMILMLAWGASAKLRAAESLYQFSGAVSRISPFVSFAPFGFELSDGLPVSGKFMFDPAGVGAASPTNPNRVDYTQIAANGFSARFGSLLVWVNKYVVTVVNNLTQPSGAADAISISFAGDLGPLFVNGVPQSVGRFSINFLGSASLFDAPALPSNIPLASYPSPLGIFSDSPTIFAGTFSVLSLERLSVLPGDYDLNQTVEGADLLLWQRATGTAGPVGDGNGDHAVDAEDLVVWGDNLGASLVTQGSVAPWLIPEPATGANVAAAAVAGIALRRSRRPARAGR
jgi:hypothetical protein